MPTMTSTPPNTPPAPNNHASQRSQRQTQRRIRRAARATGRPLTRSSSVGLGIAMIWFSALALLPLSAIVLTTVENGWEKFWGTITAPQTLAALTLTTSTALLVTAFNVVMGTAIAWVLVRDKFFGKRLLEVVIDIPFALPTIVAGLVLLSLYGPGSPLGVNIANTRIAVGLAFLFVTLPFVVRTVQPVLADLDKDVEEAAASLGASRATIFRRIILPSLAPAMTAGAALSFARGISEYGALVLLSGNLPMNTEVGSVRILSYLENGDNAAAAAVATMLLMVSLAVIVALDLVQRRVARRG
ncbi:sulfate ABC transporter permease subunit CysT [Jonesia quinghaiensis]|uniref:sulfate ABC transporter permease subunit CysT n=1 Tax=Jonesia quinghaiensis TaxID=262806 RepID=UPI0004063CCA|nr:sulfate ABC transporter permease subunit CysT [Jonesia quinghaiensis]